MQAQQRMAGREVEPGHGAMLHEELLVEIWRDLAGRVTQERIRQVAAEVAVMFRDATVTAYIPILLRRRIREQLLQDMAADEDRQPAIQAST
jgi:hypothetical protein